MRRSKTCGHYFPFLFLLLVSISWLVQELDQPGKFLDATATEEQYTRENKTSPPPTNFPSNDNLSSTPQHVRNFSTTTTTMTTSLASPSPPQTRTKVTVQLPRQSTIIVQLSGEMANNLHHIAHGVGLQLLAKEEFDIDCNIVLRHSEGPNNRSPKPKWKSARDNIQACFPTLAQWKFSEGNNKDFTYKHALQQAWLGGRMDHLLGLINSKDLSTVRRGLEFFSNEILTDAQRPVPEDEHPDASRIRVPFLYSETLDAFPIIDLYYDQIRNLMQFNDSACCGEVPNVQDSVFHFRNYESEMPERRAYDMGFAELSPAKVAQEVFGTLEVNDRVAITTRIINQKAKNYVVALHERGINATIITDQSSVKDFCFLKQAQKEVVGSARSTFVFWAALLGQPHAIRLYHVNNAGLRLRHPDYWERFTYNFTHPKLKDRLRFELYHEEETHPGF